VEHFDDTYALAPDAQAVMQRLQMLPSLAHTREARIVCVSSQRTPMLRGWPCRAFIGTPRVQGPYRPFFEWFLAAFCRPILGGEEPEYLVVIDAALWPGLDATQQERLMFHELLHLREKENPETGEPRLHEDGRPQLQVVPHDVEVFTEEVARYGAEACALDALCQAIVDGQQRIEARRGKAG